MSPKRRCNGHLSSIKRHHRSCGIEPNIQLVSSSDEIRQTVSGSHCGELVRTDGLRVLNFNIAGLPTKRDSLSVVLEENRIDVVSIVEHWCKVDELRLLHLEGFNLAAQFCRKSENRGGVCIFTRTGLEFRPVSYVECIERVFEVCVAVLKNKVKNNNLYILSVYRTPNSCVKEFINRLSILLFQLYNSRDNYIICGDTNINLLKTSDPRTELIGLLVEYDIHPHISQPTRINDISSTCIDNIFSDLKDLGKVHVSSPVFYSDHTYQLCHFEFISLCNDLPEYIYKRNFNSVNIESFYDAISREQWHEMYAADDFQDKFAAFYNALVHHYNCCFPVKKMKTRKKNKKWYSPQIKEMHNLLCEMKTTERRLNNPDYTLKYRKLLKIYKDSVEHIKKQRNDYRLVNAADLSKESWKIVNESRNKLRNKMPASINDEKGDVITETSQMCDAFNKYFLDISEHSPRPEFDGVTLENFGPSSFFLGAVTPWEVGGLLRRTTRKHAAGIDEIDGRALRAVQDLICYPLCHLINESFSHGEFPEIIKESKCIPVFKNKGSKSDVSNYRSICVQSQISKIFELCFSERLVNFLEKNKILSDAQNGFRQNKSANTAILDCLEFIYNALNGKDQVVGLFYDLSRAFDSVDHELLLSKLYAGGIRGVAYNWVSSYLGERKQTVVMDGIKSYTGGCDLGVPQGSVLGPLLFIIFVNDIGNACCARGRAVLYADDTNILVREANQSRLVEDCNHVSLQFYEYCKNNGLVLNSGKTVFVQFFPKNITVDYTLLLKVNGKSIVNTSVVKFLGLNIDQKLTWENHIGVTCGKISALCFLIKQLRGTVGEHTMRLVYFGLVQSVLQYGLLFWGSSAHFNDAFVLQKKALRCIEGVHPGTPCQNIFKKWKFLTLPCLYILQLINYVNNHENSFVRNCDVHPHLTRRAHDLRVPYSRLTVGQNSPSHIGVKCLNKMKAIIPDENCTKIFKLRARKFLCESAFYSVKDFLDYAPVRL